MKNLILTLVFAITSLIAYTQNVFVYSNIDTINVRWTSDNAFFNAISGTKVDSCYKYNVIYTLDTATNIKIHLTNVNSNVYFDAVSHTNDTINKTFNNTATTFTQYINDTIGNVPLNDSITLVIINIDNYDFLTWRSYFKIVKVTPMQWDSIQNATAGINDLELTTTRLSAYPNPTSSNITIDFDVTTNEVPVAIFSMSGQLVYSNDDNRNNGTNSLNVDVSSFQTGIYIVKAGSQTFKFVKQ